MAAALFATAIILLSLVPYTTSGQKSISSNTTLSAVSVNLDRKIYSPGASVRILGSVYNSSGEFSPNTIVTIKIDKIKEPNSGTMGFFGQLIGSPFHPTRPPELIEQKSVVTDRNGIYNSTIMTQESGDYNVSIFTPMGNGVASTGFETIDIWFTKPLYMLYIGIASFGTLMIVMLLEHRKIENVRREIENKSQGKTQGIIQERPQINNKDLQDEVSKTIIHKIAPYEIGRFVCLTIIVASFVIALVFSEVEVGANSPVGLITIHPFPPDTNIQPNVNNGQQPRAPGWYINVGGNVADNYVGGIEIPINVLVFGVAGGYLRYLYGLRFLYEVPKEAKERPEDTDTFWGDIVIYDQMGPYKHSFRSLALFFLAPLLAIAVWFVLWQGGTSGYYAIAAVSFTIGLVTEEVIRSLIAFARISLKGIKGAGEPSSERTASTTSIEPTNAKNTLNPASQQLQHSSGHEAAAPKKPDQK